MATVLVETSDDDFAWMLGEGPPPRRLRLPPGGVDERDTLEMLRALSMKLRAEGQPSNWMIVARREVVGLCGYKHVPDANGAVEFGYGIAASRRRRGHGKAAVAALIKLAKRDPYVRCLAAETSVSNIASRRVLERNGFKRTGMRVDPEDGELIVWRRAFGLARFVQLPFLSSRPQMSRGSASLR